MVAGEIDLSIGAVFIFSPFMFYQFDQAGLPLGVNLVLALLCCAVVGVINGVFTEIIGVSSFITTLGMLLGLGGPDADHLRRPAGRHARRRGDDRDDRRDRVVNGVRSRCRRSRTRSATSRRSSAAGTYWQLIWALAIVGAVQLLLTATRWGMYTIAVGSNKLAAREAGINVRLVVIRNFILCSLLAGLVGIFEAMRTSSVTPDTAGASETMFRAVSAAVIGGTLLAGGQGTAIGALFGALFLGILRDGLTLEGVNADYLDFILGIAILGAMVVNINVGRVRQRSGRAA